MSKRIQTQAPSTAYFRLEHLRQLALITHNDSLPQSLDIIEVRTTLTSTFIVVVIGNHLLPSAFALVHLISRQGTSSGL